jgi:hypothetical protein
MWLRLDHVTSHEEKVDHQESNQEEAAGPVVWPEAEKSFFAGCVGWGDVTGLVIVHTPRIWAKTCGCRVISVRVADGHMSDLLSDSRIPLA